MNTPKKSKSQSHKISTTAHLLETTAHQLGHSSRHLEAMKKDKTSAQKQFDLEHLETHVNGAIEHVQKLMLHVKKNYPKEAKELAVLENTVAHSQQLDPGIKAKIKGIAAALKG